MELLSEYKKNGYYKSTLYHLLAHKKMMPPETEAFTWINITPSVYLKEIRMSAQERIQQLNGIHISNLASGEKHMKSVLEFNPRIIVFQNYAPNDKIVAKFTVKNKSTVPTFLNMIFKESSNFFIKTVSPETQSRLAPGICMTYTVTFMPHRYEDYAHLVTYTTDKQRYVLPLIGMGPRPIFDFPDEIVIPPTPLKVENYSNLYIHNIGTIVAGFTIAAKIPFSVKPKFYHNLHPKDKGDVQVVFKSMRLGESKGKLIITLETEEVFVIKVTGTTHTVSIELEKAVVRFQDTYNTMARQQELKITNKSDHVITYMCMKNNSIYSDFHDKIKLATIFYDVKDSESAKHRKLEQYEVISSDEHERVYTRIFSDEIQSLVADESLYFNDLNFSIMPIKGNLWPNEMTTITLTFSPREIGDFVAVAFLDIDGILDRVPLTMQGTSLPPNIHLHIENLDMDNVYINKTYRYEIVAINKGHINGVIEHKDTPPLFGSVITCTPEKYCLQPGDKEAFVVSFLNSNQGPYFEELNFVIKDTDIVRKLYLKGTVVYPTITFSLPCLDFGYVNVDQEQVHILRAVYQGGYVWGQIIAPQQQLPCPADWGWSKQNGYWEPIWTSLPVASTACLELIRCRCETKCAGVPKTLQLEVINESEVNVNTTVKITSDGPEVSSITLEDCEACDNVEQILALPQWPKEFNIDPTKITMTANSRVAMKVTLTPNLVRANQTVLELELEKSDSPPITVPISFNAQVPEITPAPDIKLRACFLDFTYTYDVVVSSNEYWGYFVIEEPKEIQTLNVDVGIKRGIIRPNTTISLPVSIMTAILGPHEYIIRMHLFGLPNPIDICRISALGVRPIVTCSPLSLHWGHLKLLTRSYKTLTLANDSPVTVNFKAGILFHDGRWSIQPPEGYIEPEGETDLTLSLCLIDANTYTNKAVIHLEKVKDILVPLSAIGTGTSIIVGKDRDHVILGRHFIKLPLSVIVPVENCGTRIHSLEWTSSYKAPKAKEIPPPFFNIEPRQFKMSAGEKTEMKITGFSSKVGFIKETWYLTGSVEGINKKELLMECEISGEFVEPKVILSTTEINLQYDFGPYSEFYKLLDILTIKNVSKLPLHLDISVRPPFAIVRRDTYKIDPEDADMCCCITYDENDANLQKILKEADLQESQHFLDCITKKPVPRLREGHLHFFQNIHKIKLAFEFTHVMDELLEDEEIIKLQIVFDITKHLTLKSKVYGDIMRVKFRGHKNKDAVKIMGKINFPNVVVYTPKIDFQCILNGSMESKTIKIHNPTGLLVCYKFVIKKWSAIKVKVPELPTLEYIESETKTTHEEIHLSAEHTAEISPYSELALEQEKDMLEGPPTSLNLEPSESIILQDSELEFKIKKIKLLKKIAPMLSLEDEPKFPWAHKFNTRIKYNSNVEINELIQLTPHHGMLGPGETHFIQVIFRPALNISVRAVLECRVLGGPSEYISVSGQSSDLIYKLNTNTLNFKIRSFHERATENLIITNLAQLVFEYKTYLNEPVFENDLPAKIFEVVPSEKIVEAEEEIEVAVVVRPGVIGYFKRMFLLEIGHLPHIPIEVFGWGVIPQIYFSLPRPELSKLNVEIGYSAIATISLDYLSAVSEILYRGTAEHLNSPQTEKCFEDPDFQEWHICSAWDGYPTTMDIDMAIERLLVVNHIKSRPEIINMYTTANRVASIPGFQTIPYLVDFGVIITGNSVTCFIDVTNYGPIPVKLHFQKNYQPLVWLNIKLCGKLNPGEKNRIEMTLAPTAHDFPELEQYVDMTFNLEVPYGVSIPINVQALCAVPFLKSNIDVLDLGSVRCGDKVISSVPLKNVGKPTCVWYVTLRLRTPGPNPMTILDNSGKYEPGEGGWLSVSFKPTMEMLYEGVLIFRFHMNPTRMEIPIVGQGIFPHPHIIGPNVNFPPTLPWADTTENFFGITNLCPFPIELIIAHVDQKWKEEEELYNLLYRYYNKPEEMLVPAVKPGAGMPIEVNEFFERFKTNVQKGIEEEAAAAAKLSTKPTAKKTKSPKVKGKEKVDKETSPARKIRTEAEIIADEIRAMKDEGLDPISECLSQMEEVKPEFDKYAKGLLVFLHGSPCEETFSKEMAYTLGMSLGIPTVNFDSCFIQALCESQCVAKTVIMTALNENLETLRKSVNRDLGSDEDDSFEDPYAFSECLDEFEIVTKKLELFSSNKTLGTPRSKASDKKKKDVSRGGSVLVMGNTTSMFQMDLIHELLTDFFSQEKFQCGFIVDSLTSILVKIPMLVLTTVLRCKNDIYNLHLVLCQSDFNTWAQGYEQALHEAELAEEQFDKVKEYTDEEIEEIVNNFEKMDREEYENADPDLKAIYIKNGLEERRRKFIEKNTPAVPDMLPNKKEKTKETNPLQSALSEKEDKKKGKKEDMKGKPGAEYFLYQTKYNEYQKTVYENLIQFTNNWIVEEGDLGFPLVGLNGAVLGAGPKKSKKPKSEIHLTDSVVETEEPLPKGFPLTIIMFPCLQYKEALVNMFKCPFIETKIKGAEKLNLLDLPVKRQEYTVLLHKVMPTLHHEEPLQWRFLEEAPIKKCECNQITDLNLLDDTTQDNVLNILSKWYCVCGKKVTSSQTSTSEIPPSWFEKSGSEKVEEEVDPFFYPLPLHSVPSITAPEERIILEPGDLVRCKYAFNPTLEGHFNIKRYVEVAGWPESRVDINISGICDLPRLDNRPKKMFANFVRRTQEDEVYKLTFLDDLKKFEFGPIFVGANRIYEEEYTIELKNASLLTTDVEIEFIEPTDIFEIDKNFISLEPGCRGQLKVTAAPPRSGDHLICLLFSIKDNPEPVNINISCSGVLPIAEVLPLSKNLDYGKHLLYRREDDRFIVKNDSILPIMWKVRNPEDFVEDFILSRTTGIVPRNENHVVPVTYIACNVGIISQMPMVIDIYDELGRGEPMIVDSIWLSAECYDVMVECAYENANDSYLNFGNVKVNSTVYRDMFLLNRGKYNIYYKLKKVKHFPEPALLKSFECSPDCGIIPPTLKLVAVEFNCTPTASMNLNNVPAYTCSLLDGSKEQVVVAKFPVPITIASFYNTFTLFPLGELNFHIIAVGSGVMRDVILNNTSKCPFNYEIVVPEQYRLEPEDAQALPKDKTSKLKNPPIKCGNFLIVNEDNLLAPGDSRTIPIQFLATEARTFEETIHFIVSDTCPAEAQGVPLRLVGTGAMPVLDFWNLENTFREHLIVKTMDDYKVPESSAHCIFVEDSVTLHFFCVTVNTSYTGKIDLYNNGVVACILTMKMIYQPNTNEDIFSLDRYEMQIDPLLHKGLNIKFSPKELLEYRAVLEIKLKLLYNREQTFHLCLVGEGVIPRIRMLKPPIRQHRLALLTFPVTCLGSTSYKKLQFKNIVSVNSIVSIEVLQAPEKRPVFWLVPNENCRILNESEETEYLSITVTLKPSEVAALTVYFSPLVKGRTNCDIKVKIEHNPYEYYTVMCEAEAFIEDVILLGLEMLPMDYDIDAMKVETGTNSGVNGSDVTGRKKSKSARTDKQKSKDTKSKYPMGPDGEVIEPVVLKYLLDFGGCEICSAHKRSVIMLNNSERVYKFVWEQLENILIKPTVGYISPGEEKDIEVMFYSALPVNIRRELLVCNLLAISDEDLTLDSKGATWDNRQIHTLFDFNPETGQNERLETLIEDPSSGRAQILGFKNIIILYSVTTEYTKYLSNLNDETKLKDTFIYQKRNFDFKVDNVGAVPMKISWNFFVEDEYPARIDRRTSKKEKSAISELPTVDPSMDESNNRVDDNPSNKEAGSKETLFSSIDTYSVDTWFEMDTPFTIEPKRACLNPQESQIFTVTFSPLDVFDFTVRLRSSIDNLDPYDQNLSCKIKARSLVPYVHLDLEESDYLSRRKSTSNMVLPEHMQILEFKVLGSGCYKKTFQVINPTSEAYEFVFSPILPEQKADLTSKDFIPVHCDKLKDYLEGGTSTPVTFTFTPTAPGIYESQWKFQIKAHNLTIPLMVVGMVREADVVMIPTIMTIKNSLVGFTAIHTIKLKNNENEALAFEFKGDSLVNESGKTIVVVRPKSGVLKPYSDTGITIYYTPVQDGPLSFKIFCRVANMLKDLTLCVNALSHLVKPTVTYYIIGNEHKLDHDVVTNIHLEQTASSYERTIPFKIKNDGSTSFAFEWNYVVATVKKYLTVSVEPRTGYVMPAAEVECVLHFNLKTVPVQAYPVTLTISDGPLFQIYLYAEIEKPLYHFSCKEYDFGKCIIGAPHRTYKKNLAFTNDGKESITLDLATESKAELYLDYRVDPQVNPGQRAKIPIYFRPNAAQQYEFKLQFWVNSLVEEIITIRGEGVPLLVDLYEGCQKSFDLGPVKVGEKIIREIEVMNHSKVPIECRFVFKEVYPVIGKIKDTESLGTSICIDPRSPALQGTSNTGPSRVQCVKTFRDDQKQAQIEKDIVNALASVKVIPNRATIRPHMKFPLKIHFKPMGLISELKIQLNVVVLEIVRPLVLLSGSATGMSLCFSQNSLQFGRVRKRGCKILKVMLYNKGDFGAKFCWQPLISEEFTISPMNGTIEAKQNVTFSITFRPLNYNPFVKIWASLNIENYPQLELALYAACVDVGTPQNQSIYIECPVREVKSEYIIVTNPTDETWFVLSEFSTETPSFETLREFYVEANSTFEIPIHFKPKTFGQHEAQVLFSPLGESALFVTLIGAAVHPNPNGVIDIVVEAKKSHTEPLTVYNITENPELYIVSTELVKVVPDKFDGYYEIKYPDAVRVWGEAKGTCMLTFICFETCDMILKVMFVNEETREYQFYNINVTVKPSQIQGTLRFTCRARESVQQELTVTNPLARDSSFNVVSEKLHCTETIHVNRNSHAQLTMTYSPLVVGEFEDTLTIENYLIGVYTYRVICVCKPAKEKTLEFSTAFGTIIPVRLRVHNRSNSVTSFVATATHPSTILEKHYELQPFEKGKFLIWFEPSELGVQNSRVVFNSDIAGEFVFNIKGIGAEPKPQGPYEIRGGSYTFIKFKNVFDDVRTFRIFVDREDFSVKTQMEQVKPKKEIRVQVYLTDKPARGWSDPPTGSLTIENFDPIEPKVQWTFFLQGIP